jgi:hypothetical protein
MTSTPAKTISRIVGLLILVVSVAVPGSFGGASAAVASDTSASSRREAAVRPPTAVRCYRDSVNAADLDRLAACFTPGGLVIDVSRRIQGRSAIRAWAQAEVIGGKLTIIRRIARPRNPRGVTYLVRFAPPGSGGFLAHYRFETLRSKISVADLQYPG